MISFFIYKKTTSNSSNRGRLEDVSVVWNFQTTETLESYFPASNKYKPHTTGLGSLEEFRC